MNVKTKKRWWISAVLLACVALFAAGCGSGGQSSTSGTADSGQQANNAASAGSAAEPAGSDAASGEKTYVVATEAAYPPFEKLEGDKITGFDIDVINAVAEAAGIDITIQNTSWDAVFAGVDDGKVDIAISSITITEDRKQKYDFTDGYFEANQLILVPENSTVTKLADLRGMKIGVQSGTTGEEVVKKAFGKTYDGIKGYDALPSAVDDFFNGRVEAVVADNGVLTYYANQISGKKYKLIQDESFEKEYYGILVKKGNSELLAKLNQGLKTIKENGKLDEIHKQYFGQ